MTTDQTTNDSTVDDGTDDPAGLRRQIKELNAKLVERDTKLATLERNSLFDAAGIPSDGAGKYFRAGYSGELTAEAIKVQAETDGIITPAEPPPADTPPVDQLAHQRADEITATPPVAPPDLGVAMVEAAKQGPEALEQLMASHGLTPDY